MGSESLVRRFPESVLTQEMAEVLTSVSEAEAQAHGRNLRLEQVLV